MIELTRLNGAKIFVNPNHIRFIEMCPETLLTFFDGKTLMVKESVDAVNEMMSRTPNRVEALSCN